MLCDYQIKLEVVSFYDIRGFQSHVLNTQVFGVVGVCHWANNSRRFEGTQRLHLQGQTFFDCSTTKIKPPQPLGRSRSTLPTRPLFPEVSHPSCVVMTFLTHLLARTHPADPPPTIMKSYLSPLCSCEGELTSLFSCTLMYEFIKLINLYSVATL